MRGFPELKTPISQVFYYDKMKAKNSIWGQGIPISILLAVALVKPPYKYCTGTVEARHAIVWAMCVVELLTAVKAVQPRRRPFRPMPATTNAGDDEERQR